VVDSSSSGPGVVGVGERLSAGLDGKGDAADTGVSMTDSLYTCENKK
jgi:hypothetical protein